MTAGGIKAAICALQKGDVGIGVLQETKLTEGIYMWQSAGYSIWEMEAGIRHCSIISFAWRR